MNYFDANDIFNCIFLTENSYIWIKILLKFVPRCPTNSKLPLVQMVIWCWNKQQAITWTNDDSYSLVHH